MLTGYDFKKTPLVESKSILRCLPAQTENVWATVSSEGFSDSTRTSKKSHNRLVKLLAAALVEEADGPPENQGLGTIIGV